MTLVVVLLLLACQAVVHEVAVVFQHVLEVGVSGQVLMDTQSDSHKNKQLQIFKKSSEYLKHFGVETGTR